MNFSNSRAIKNLAAKNDRDGLHRFLEHSNKAARFEAAAALAELEDGRGWRYLMDAARQPQDLESQASAIEILGDLGHPRAIPVLVDALKQARGEAAEIIKEALEAIGGVEAEQALREAGFEPVAPRMTGSQQIIDFDPGLVREPQMDSTFIKIHTAEQHFNTAAELREAERAERGLVEISLTHWLAPNWPYAWYLRGVLHEDLDRHFEAWLCYQHSLKLDPTQQEVGEALTELQEEQNLQMLESDLLLKDLHDHRWHVRRDAAAGLGALGTGAPPEAVEYLIEGLTDEDREVRHAVIEALGNIGDSNAVTPLTEIEESSWLLRFAIIEALAKLRSVYGLEVVLRKEMQNIHERNPIFSRQKDPLLELEFDLLMEVGVLAFEKTGDLNKLLEMAEDNRWEDVNEVEQADAFAVGDSGDAYDEEDEEVEEDLASFVDEIAQMASMALERLALPKLSTLDIDTLNRLAAVPDLTLMDVTGEGGQPLVVYDLSSLRQAVQGELEKR